MSMEGLLESGMIKTTVASDEEKASLALWQQGDVELNTANAIRDRSELRRHPKVLAALDAFWKATLRSIQQNGREQDTTLNMYGYTYLFQRVYRVLIHTWDAEDAEECIGEDWEQDAKGRESLAMDQLYDSLFELADTW